MWSRASRILMIATLWITRLAFRFSRASWSRRLRFRWRGDSELREFARASNFICESLASFHLHLRAFEGRTDLRGLEPSKLTKLVRFSGLHPCVLRSHAFCGLEVFDSRIAFVSRTSSSRLPYVDLSFYLCAAFMSRADSPQDLRTSIFFSANLILRNATFILTWCGLHLNLRASLI